VFLSFHIDCIDPREALNRLRRVARRTLEIGGASHVVGVSHPDETAQLVLEAAHAASLSPLT
jgi:hypothetical protein